MQQEHTLVFLNKTDGMLRLPARFPASHKCGDVYLIFNSEPVPSVVTLAGACSSGLAAGMDFSALSMPGGTLTAPLGEVAPNMTLLEALQTRQAQDMLSALEAARTPSRHPLDISLQVPALPPVIIYKRLKIFCNADNRKAHTDL